MGIRLSTESLLASLIWTNLLMNMKNSRKVYQSQVPLVGQIFKLCSIVIGVFSNNYNHDAVPKRRTEATITTKDNEILPKRLRRDCENCTDLMHQINQLKSFHEASITALKSDHDASITALKSDHDAAMRGMHDHLSNLQVEIDDYKYKLKLEKAKLAQRHTTAQGLRKKKNNALKMLNLRQSKDVTAQANVIKNLRISATWREKNIEKLKVESDDLQKKNRELFQEINQLHLYIDDLECNKDQPTVAESEEEGKLIKTRQHSYKTRKIVYRALEAKIPFAHQKTFLQKTLKELSVDQIQMPGPATISRMMSEVGVLSYIQAAEALLHSDGATLAWDATSIGALHINEVHVHTAQDKTYTLSLTELPGGRTADYVSHITDVVDRMASIYAAFKKEDARLVKLQMLFKITSTLSDRVNTNGAIVRELRQLWNSELIQLNCNLHPLDSFAKRIKDEFKKQDPQLNLSNWGHDCCAVNFLYSLCKMRNKATCDPAGFTAHLQKNNIPPNEFPRWVGNKWNLIFETARAAVHRKDCLKEYLQKFCKKEKQRQDLLKSIDNDGLMSQLRALALVGDLITTPYMQLFYKNSQKLSNLEMVPHINAFASKIKAYSSNLSLLTTATCDVFDKPLGDDSVRTDLQSTPLTPGSIFEDALRRCLVGIQMVIDSQLSGYLNSTIDADTIKKTKASPPHNVWAERVLGMYNAFFDRACNASSQFLEKRVILSTNNTLDWLDTLPLQEQEEIISFAVKHAAIVRREEADKKQKLKQEIHLRLIQTGQKRDMTARNAFTKRIAGVLKVKGQDVSSLNVFQEYCDLDDRAKERVKEVFDKAVMKGTKFVQAFEEPDGEELHWCGEIVDQSKRGTGITVLYIKFSIGFQNFSRHMTQMKNRMSSIRPIYFVIFS